MRVSTIIIPAITFAIGLGIGLVLSRNEITVLKNKIKDDKDDKEELESLYSFYEYRMDDYENDIQVLENKIHALRVENAHLRNHIVPFAG